jgi:hypothetical protein
MPERLDQRIVTCLLDGATYAQDLQDAVVSVIGNGRTVQQVCDDGGYEYNWLQAEVSRLYRVHEANLSAYTNVAPKRVERD